MVADILYRVIKLLLKLAVSHVKLHFLILLPCLETLETLFLRHFFQLIQEKEAKSIHHPSLERHAWFPVFQWLKVVFIKIEIIFVGK